MSPVSVTYWGFLHFLIIAFFFLFAWAMLLLAKAKGKDFAKKLILALMWGNFAVHFLRQFTPYYFERWPFALYLSSALNLCAVLVLAAPFLFMFGNALLKEYLVIMSILGGAIALLFPTTPVELGARVGDFWTFLEMVRYCLCHYILIVTAMLMLYFGFHKLNYRRLPMEGVLFLGALTIIFLNKFAMWGLLKPDPAYMFFDSEFENPSYVFGIPNRLADNPILALILQVFVWPFLRYTLPNGATAYLPVVWIVPLLYLLLLPALFLVLYLPLDFKRIRSDCAFLIRKINGKKKAEQTDREK